MAYPYQETTPPMQTPQAAALPAFLGGAYPAVFPGGYTASSYAEAAYPGGVPACAYAGGYQGVGGTASCAAPTAGVISGAPAVASTSAVPPGTTNYFTTPHLGGFYAATSSEHALKLLQQQQAQVQQQLQAQLQFQQQIYLQQQQQQQQVDMAAAVAAGGRLYTGWAGVPDSDDKGRDTSRSRTKDEAKHRHSGHRGSRVRSNSAAAGTSTSTRDRRLQGSADETISGATTARSASTSPPPPPWAAFSRYRVLGSERGDGRHHRREESYDRRQPALLVCEVPVQMGGSGSIVVHGVDGGGVLDDGRRPRRHRHSRHHRRRHHDVHYSDDSGADTDTDSSSSSLSSSPPPPTPPPPMLTSFTVSARRMRQTARNWAALCRRGEDTCNLLAGDDPAAVLGLYRMLEVLHMGLPPGRAAAAVEAAFSASSSFSSSSSSSPPPPPPPPPPSPRPPFSRPPLPVVLPPRVLAYVVMFGVEFGALGPANASRGQGAKKQDPFFGSGGSSAAAASPNKPRMLLPKVQSSESSSLSPPSLPSLPSSLSAAASARPSLPLPNLLRARAAAWLDAFAYSVGSSPPSSSSSSSSSSPQPPTTTSTPHSQCHLLARDWPYVLYTARVLGHRALFCACVRLLLDQWGPLVQEGEDGGGGSGGGGRLLAGLPPAMQATVLRDMACLRAARMRSVESIVNAAMQTFPPSSL